MNVYAAEGETRLALAGFGSSPGGGVAALVGSASGWLMATRQRQVQRFWWFPCVWLQGSGRYGYDKCTYLRSVMRGRLPGSGR